MTLHPARALALLLPLVGPLAACGDSARQDADINADIQFVGDAPDAADTASVSFGYVDLCDRWAESWCKVLTCEGSSPEDELDLCISTQREVCDHEIANLLDSHLDAGELAFSATNAEACWSPLLGAACGDLGALSEPLQCGAIVLGAATTGAPCAFDAVCGPGLFCAPGTDGTCPGTCTARAADGAACDSTTALCGASSACLSTFQTGLQGPVCGALKLTLGTACVADQQCYPLGYCDATSSTCTAYKANGVGCGDAAECAIGVCSPEGQVCADLPTAGQACEFRCADGFVCTATTKICIVGPTEIGDPCAEGAFFPCGVHGNMQCDATTDTCVGPFALGAPCGGADLGDRCDHGYCDAAFPAAGTCKAWKKVGESCTGFNDCGPFLRCNSDKLCGLYGDPCRGPALDTLW